MKKILKITLAAAVAFIFIWTLYFLYQKNQEDPIIYETEQPATRTIIRKSVATGSVIPRNEIFVKPRISGIIQDIYVQAGDLIKAGTTIARVKVIPDMVSLNNSENRVNRAKISLENAKLDFERNKQLFEQQVISKADFQPFELNKQQAIEELNAAEDALAIIKEGVSKKSTNTSNTLITAPVTGMVLDVPIEEGDNVIESNNFNEGTTIASLADMENLIFKGKVDESEVEKLKLGMELIMTVGAIEGQNFTATLEYIAPKGVEENGAIQFEIEAAVKIPEDQFIRAGYSANADVVLERKENVLSINEALLLFEDEKPYVEVEVGDQKFERRDIKTGLSDGIFIEVLEGLSEQDKVKKQK